MDELKPIAQTALPDLLNRLLGSTPILANCQDCGKQITDDTDSGEPGFCAPCLGVKSSNEKKRLFNSRIYEAFGKGTKPISFTFLNFDVTDDNGGAFRACRDFNPRGENIFLWGKCGTGKTHLACALFKTQVSREVWPSYFFRWPQFTRLFRKKSADEETQLISDFGKAKVLVIDELGTGKESDFALQILQEVLDARDWNNRNGLVLTSNYSLEDLAQKFGHDAVISRIAGLCRPVESKGPDRRLGGLK